MNKKLLIQDIKSIAKDAVFSMATDLKELLINHQKVTFKSLEKVFHETLKKIDNADIKIVNPLAEGENKMNIKKLRRRAAKHDLKIVKDEGFFYLVYVGTGANCNYVVSPQLPDLDEVASWLDILESKKSN